MPRSSLTDSDLTASPSKLTAVVAAAVAAAVETTTATVTAMVMATEDTMTKTALQIKSGIPIYRNVYVRLGMCGTIISKNASEE
jgi:hypothetical protein